MNEKIRKAVEKTLQKQIGHLNIVDYKIDGTTISLYIILPEITRTVTITDPAELLTIKYYIHDNCLSGGPEKKSSYDRSPDERRRQIMSFSRLGYELHDQLIKYGVIKSH